MRVARYTPPSLSPKPRMTRNSGRGHRLCFIGRVAQRLGCLPKRLTSTQVYYPITIRPVDNDSDCCYSDDIDYNPGPRLPPPHLDEVKPQMIPYTATYRYEPPQLPKSPNKSAVAQTVPLSALPLPAVNALPACTSATTCVTLNPELPPVHSAGQPSQTPYWAPPSTIPQNPCQNAIPGSILQDLGNITPTQYTWNTPHGVLTYTPTPISTLLPNPFPELGSSSPGIVDVWNGSAGPTGPGLIPSPISSDTSDTSSYSSGYDHRSGVALSPFIASNYCLPRGTPVEWNVSKPVETARHVLGDDSFVTNAHEPVTNPPTTKLHIELHFIDQPDVKWNWEPITIKKRRPIRIVDVFHSIHDYFQTQLTHAEYDVIKSHGMQNARIVRDSWRERINSQQDEGARSTVYSGGLRRVDCLGSSKKFAGLWVDGSQLKLGLCV